MKKLSVLYLLSLCAVFSYAQEPLQVMSFNIRYDSALDSLNGWQYRRANVASQILFHDADIIGVQEALHNQVNDLQHALDGYAYTGVGRDDGKTKGEYSAVFYNTKRLLLLGSSTFWLSKSPAIPGSKSWDAAITRIVSWAKFRDKKNGKIFFFFNTHFDHIGKIARSESATMILNAIDSLAGKNTAIVTGDFNATPADEPIRLITDTRNPLRLTDTREVSKTAHYGPTGTFNAFGPKETGNEPIDYIFFNKNVTVLKHATLSQSWQGRYSSDHFPVWVKLVIN